MEYKDGENYSFLALVENINLGNDFGNINVILEDKTKLNIKLKELITDKLKLNKIYYFNVSAKLNKLRERIDLVLIDYVFVYDYYKDDLVKLDYILKCFYKYAPINIKEVKEGIERYLNLIDNKIIYDITKLIYDKYVNSFYVFPAATKFHHAYIGGLAYHTYMMLKMAEAYISCYRHLDKSYCYGGIILHDILKVVELSEAEGAEYTLKGQLIGHINLCCDEIALCAEKLNYCDKEEVTLLKHIILSHHGQLNFGSPKRPMIAEALLVNTLDTFDSKMTVLQEVLDETNPGEFTENLQVLDKNRFYKKLSDNN